MDELMRTSEAARMLNVHINTVRRWNNQGLISSYRVGPCQDRRFRCEVGNTMGISTKNLSYHVHKLAGQIGERNVFRPQALRQAAEYIHQVWLEQGYEVVHYPYDLKGERWANLEVTRYGKERPSEIILIGAHYDSVVGCPGANDNGSGVAALLELSRRLSQWLPSRTVRFVAFVNEELPFFQTSHMGSRVYAKMAHQRGDDIRAMISLETIGYYSNKRGSQNFPPVFNFFYPSRGNFIMFVSNLRSRSLLRRAVASFRAHSDFPVKAVATFGVLPGVNRSDHHSFWSKGYRALMVTDTAPYRYPYYHTAQDTPDKINYELLACVTEGLHGVISELAAREKLAVESVPSLLANELPPDKYGFLPKPAITARTKRKDLL